MIVSDDGMTWTVTIRDDVKIYGRGTLTAEDVHLPTIHCGYQLGQ